MLVCDKLVANIAANMLELSDIRCDAVGSCALMSKIVSSNSVYATGYAAMAVVIGAGVETQYDIYTVHEKTVVVQLMD